MEKSADAFRTISEVADDLKLPQHVLRFWETRFPQIRPLKRGGNRRFYRPDDVELLRTIKTLLYGEGFTIRGVQRLLKERGPRATARAVGERGALFGAAGSTTSLETAVEPDDTEIPDDDDADAGFDRDLEDGRTASPELVLKLQMVLFEVSECRRILAAVRE